MTLREFIAVCLKELPPQRGDVTRLADWLYRQCLTRRCRPTAPPDQRAEETTGTRDNLITAFTRANACPSAWRVVTTPTFDGETLVTLYDGLHVVAGPTEWRRTHDIYEINLPQYIIGDDDWYRADFGGFDAVRHESLARLYADVTPAGAETLLRTISRAALDHALCCRLKLALEPVHYQQRRDVCILYFRRAEGGALIPRILEILRLLPIPLQRGEESVPLTQSLSPGVGYAEDPHGGNESFGQHRCRVIAEALQQCSPTTTENEAYATVCNVWQRHGLSPDTPWEDALE